jgi:UbiD family decarboxylase
MTMPTDEKGIGSIRDSRDWMRELEQRGLLRRVTAKVDWKYELGAICRAVLCKKGPALLFENIKDHENTFCGKVFVGGLGTEERVKLCLGLPANTSTKEASLLLRKKIRQGIPPVTVQKAVVQENVIMGDQIDLLQIPVPWWHPEDGGRFIDTFSGIVSKDPETGLVNVGMYRGMLVDKNKIAKLLLRSQDWGKHYTKWEALGKPMPLAIFYGGDDLLALLAACPFPNTPGVSEYEIAGAVRGEPIQLVKCKTIDLEVPANADIVVEGHITEKELHMEGPFGEYTGFYGGGSSYKPTMTVDCLTHRNDPIFRGSVEGIRPDMPNEDSSFVPITSSAIAWSVLDSAEVPGIVDVYVPPVAAGSNIYVQIHKQYRGHAKLVASALWGAKSSQWMWKNVMVVEEDIDIRNREDIEWAWAYLVNAGDGDITFFGPTLGSPLDPSTRREERDAVLYGTGKWHRVLVDATRNWEHKRWEEWNNNVYPPLNKMSIEDERLIRKRWDEYNLGLPYLTEEESERLTREKLMKILPVVGSR